MNFNDKYLSIPPYLSTTWDNIISLQMEGSSLKITMKEGGSVYIPDLDMLEIEDLFAAHESYLNHKSSNSNKELLSQINPDLLSQRMEIPFKIGVGNSEGFSGMLQHNPEFANAPDMPQEILKKIGAIAKILSPRETLDFPPPEPHCNCPHCQISRAIFQNEEEKFENTTIEIEDFDQPVKDEELEFNQWAINHEGDQLYLVENKLDANEKYHVFLGKPIGCTCGMDGCEHILAVLKS